VAHRNQSNPAASERKERKNSRLCPAPETRKKVAHGETVGSDSEQNKAPAGAKENIFVSFATHPALPGSGFEGFVIHKIFMFFTDHCG
jgi:hypothetical protein